MSQWINTDEQLPDVDVSVLAYFASDDELEVVSISGYIQSCMSGHEYSPVWSQITHWMPLPDKPDF